MIMLTPKREAFAQAIANGKNQSDAYRAAYACENWKPDSIWNKASALMRDARVLARIAELKSALAEKALWTREDSVNALRRVLEDPDKASDIVQAVKELNAMHGYNAPTKLEHTGDSGGPITFTKVQLVPFSHEIDSED
jgi:hypothetical protein